MLALLFMGLGLARVPVADAALSAAPLLRPVAQCAETAEVAVGPYMEFAAVDYQWYCGPTYVYPPEWYAAHIGAYPQYYAPFPVEPTTCGTYHFFYQNVWYCYTGP